MKHIDENMQLYIREIFFANYKFDVSKKMINSSTSKMFFKLNPEIKKYCEKILIDNPNFQNLNSLLKCIVFNIDLPSCKMCGKELNFKQMMTKKQYCSLTCAERNPVLIQQNKRKRIATCLKKYGVKNSSEFTAIKEKIKCALRNLSKTEKEKIIQKQKSTCLKRYGHISYMQTQQFKKRSKQTCLKKYGTEYANQSPIVRQQMKETLKNTDRNGINKKIENTYLEKYGVKHHMLLPQHQLILKIQGKEKMWNTIMEYSDYILPMFAKNELQKFNSNKKYAWKCVKCGNVFQSHIHRTMHIEKFPYLPRCLKCYPYLSCFSKQQKEILEYVKTIYNGIVIENDRKLIKPYQLDIVIPQKKIAIQFNGDYWHQQGTKKPIGYHQLKENMCEKINYTLISIWQHDWIKNKKEILQMIKNKILNK